MSTRAKTNMDFTEGKIFRKLLKFILALAATNLLISFYGIADTMIVGLSDEPNAVGAIGTTGPLTALIINLFIGFSAGGEVMVARHIGAKDNERTEKAVHTSVFMSMLFGLLGAGAGAAMSNPIMRLMGLQGNILKLATTYLYIYFAGIPFLSVTNYLAAIFRAKGDSRTPLIVLMSTGLINVLLNLLFVVGFGMAVEGVALATSIANVLSCVILLWRLSKGEGAAKFSFKKLKIDKREFMAIVHIGLPAGLQSAIASISNMLIQSSIVSVNNAVVPSGVEYQPIVNGNAAAASLAGFIYTGVLSVGQGVVAFTSQNLGAKKYRRIQPILYNGFLMSFVVSVAMSAAMMLFKTPLLSLYGVRVGTEGSLERMAYDAATMRLWYTAVPYFIGGFLEIASGVLRGLGKSVTSMVISLSVLCGLRILWLLIVFPLYPTLFMILVTFPALWALGAIIKFVVVQVCIKRLKEPIQEAENIESSEEIEASAE